MLAYWQRCNYICICANMHMSDVQRSVKRFVSETSFNSKYRNDHRDEEQGTVPPFVLGSLAVTIACVKLKKEEILC